LTRPASAERTAVDDPATTYEAVVAAVQRNKEIIEELEREPPSPKRDAALARLRELQAQAINRLGELGPTALS
jgi:hypothetical protein